MSDPAATVNFGEILDRFVAAINHHDLSARTAPMPAGNQPVYEILARRP